MIPSRKSSPRTSSKLRAGASMTRCGSARSPWMAFSGGCGAGAGTDLSLRALHRRPEAPCNLWPAPARLPLIARAAHAPAELGQEALMISTGSRRLLNHAGSTTPRPPTAEAAAPQQQIVITAGPLEVLCLLYDRHTS